MYTSPISPLGLLFGLLSLVAIAAAAVIVTL
jgi:hypothetical protein